MTEFEKRFLERFKYKFSTKRIYLKSDLLASEFSEYFSEWWNPEKYDWEDSEFLAKYCSEYIQWKIDGYKLRKVEIEQFSLMKS